MQDLKQFYIKKGIASKWADCRVTDFKNTEVGEKIEKYLRTFDERFKTGHSLCLVGPPGSGKTHACLAIYNHLLLETRYSPHIYYFDTLISALTATWSDPKERKYFIKRIMNPHLYMLEDLGSEISLDKSASDLAIKSLAAFLKYRLVSSSRPAIITTKMYPVELKELYGESVSSILKEFFTTLDFSEFGDRRKERTL